MARGSVIKRGAKNYTVVVDLPRDADGKRRQKWYSGFTTKRKAEAELARLLHELERGVFIEPSELTVGEWLKQWLTHVKPNVARSTYSRYQGIVDGHLIPAIGNIPLGKLRPLHIQRYYADALKDGCKRPGFVGKPLTAKTVRHHHGLLHTALTRAVKLQILQNNPADAVEKPRPRPVEMQALDEKQVGRLLATARGTSLYMPVLLAITTGMRRGEILGLRWTDVDPDAGTLAVRQTLERTNANEPAAFKEPKTRSGRRVIALPASVVRALHRHREEQKLQKLMIGAAYDDHGMVCARPDGRPMRPDTVTVTFPRLVKKADLPPIRFHDLRHTHATLLLRQGEHPKVVSERLGHSSIGMTIDKYSHVLPDMQKDAASRLDARLADTIDG